MKYNYCMANISASIPDRLKDWIEAQIDTGFYTSTSDYVRDLIRADQQKKQQLDSLLLDGINSGDAIAVTDDYWKAKKTAITSK